MGKDKNREKTNKRSASAETMKGTLDIARSGMGFVIVEGLEQDIIVRPNDMNGAFAGDKVKVGITRAADHRRRYEGRITEVLERKQTEFIGTIEVSPNFAFVSIDSKRTIPDFFVHPSKLHGAQNGNRVIVKFVQWQQGDKKPEGEVIEVLKQEDENDMAMKGILIENNFPLEFSAEVMEEAMRLPDVIGEDVIAQRKDMREMFTITIDPVDAKDFDDAISFRLLSNGLWEIGVHIADVSHYVLPGTKLDESAYERATSVYLPDRVNPMLPERISNELCSLRPHEDKCTFSAVFQINDKAEVKHYWLGRTIIHSDHRFTYEDVQETIEKREGVYEKEIWILNDLAQKFRRKRFAAGAINFSSSEVRFKLDEKGKPISVMVKESKEAHQLIEEFMLLANRTVAEYVSKIKLNKKPVPFPYRIHATPDQDKLKPFAAFAKKFGYTFDMKDEAAVASSFNKLLQEVKGKPEQHVLEQLGIRTMAKAIYTSQNVGHYGLGFEHYAHFTSPIRRYPDVMVHRILQECLDKNPIVDKQMDEKCKHCSERERGAMDSERAGNKYKQVEYMQDYLGHEFPGVISGVAAFGFWVETVEHKCEGLVSSRDLLTWDDFRLDETDYALVGLRTGTKFRMGDQVTIKVVSANLSKRQLDYEIVLNGKRVLTSDDEAAVKTIANENGRDRKKKKKK